MNAVTVALNLIPTSTTANFFIARLPNALPPKTVLQSLRRLPGPRRFPTLDPVYKFKESDLITFISISMNRLRHSTYVRVIHSALRTSDTSRGGGVHIFRRDCWPICSSNGLMTAMLRREFKELCNDLQVGKGRDRGGSSQGWEGMNPREDNTGIKVPIKFEEDRGLILCVGGKPVVESLRVDQTKSSIRIPGEGKLRDDGMKTPDTLFSLGNHRRTGSVLRITGGIRVDIHISKVEDIHGRASKRLFFNSSARFSTTGRIALTVYPVPRLRQTMRLSKSE